MVMPIHASATASNAAKRDAGARAARSTARAAAAGPDHQREDEQDPDDLDAGRDGQRHDRHEVDAESGGATRRLRLGELRLQRGEEERTADDREGRKCRQRENGKDAERVGGNREHVAEKERRRLRRERRCSSAGRGGRSRARSRARCRWRRRGALSRSPRRPMAMPAASVNPTMPPRGAMPISPRGGRPGEADMGRAHGRRRSGRARPGNADDAGKHRDDAARGKRGHHEVVVEHAHGWW